MNYSFLIRITNECNLNCLGCCTTCETKNQNSWHISKEDFINSLKILNKKLPNLETIDITGGETLIHPNFLELCDILSEYPNMQYNIWTNGILLDKFSDEQLIDLNNKNITFKKSLYPILIKHNEEQEKRFNKLNIPLNSSGLRLFFNKLLFSKTKKYDYLESFKTCFHFNEPYQFVLYKNKIYGCCTQPHIIEKLKLDEDFSSSYIDINEFNGEEDLKKLISQPNEICSHCGTLYMDGNENFPWSLDTISKNYYTSSLKELYLYHYDDYFNLYNNKLILNYMPNILNNIKYIKKLGREKGNHYGMINHYYKKFFGVLDIIVPFSKDINMDQLNKIKKILDLNNQNLNLYFISIEKNNEIIESKIFQQFTPFHPKKNYNIWYFKGQDIQHIVNNYTFSPYIYYLPLSKNIINTNKLLKRK